MNKIRKAVIPAAGFGTRFLPATKAIPKEMLPIVDKPTIQYIVEEAVASGITEIIIVTNSYKASIENHFDISFELEEKLKASNDQVRLKIVQDISNMANIYSVRQKNPRGLGHAILCAKDFIGDEPFAILLGDDIVVNKDGEPAIKQLMDCFEKTGQSVVGVQTVPHDMTYKYGIIAPKAMHEDYIEVDHFVEKPSVEESPSDYAILGRYILTPDIFPFLETQQAGKGNEIQLTDAIERLRDKQDVFACAFEGKRYDVGGHDGFLRAQVDFALDREDTRDIMLDILHTFNKDK